MNSYRIIGLDGGELRHSGILGMKWGKRRYQNSDGSLTPLGRSHYGVGAARKKTAKETSEKTSKSKTTSEESATKKKSVSEMTNKELDEYITRLQKEKQVKELTDALNKTSVNSSENTKKANKGKSWIADVASRSATSATTTILTATMVYAAGGVINKMVGDKVVKGGKGYPDKDKKKD